MPDPAKKKAPFRNQIATPIATIDPDKLVTVCSACLQASCWQGEFYCDDYKTAGTVEKTVAQLRELNREHESYWRL